MAAATTAVATARFIVALGRDRSAARKVNVGPAQQGDRAAGVENTVPGRRWFHEDGHRQARGDHAQAEGRCEPLDTPRVEGEQKGAHAPEGRASKQAFGNHVAADCEEDIDAHEAARSVRHVQMEEDDGDHSDGPQAIDVSAIRRRRVRLGARANVSKCCEE